MSGSVSMVDGHIDPDKNEMTPKKACKILKDTPIRAKGNHTEYSKALHLAMAALEKQIPKRYIRENIEGFETPIIKCPDCLSLIGRVAVLEIGEVVMVSRFCSICGKAIDRGDTE